MPEAQVNLRWRLALVIWGFEFLVFVGNQSVKVCWPQKSRLCHLSPSGITSVRLKKCGFLFFGDS